MKGGLSLELLNLLQEINETAEEIQKITKRTTARLDLLSRTDFPSEKMKEMGRELVAKLKKVKTEAEKSDEIAKGWESLQILRE